MLRLCIISLELFILNYSFGFSIAALLLIDLNNSDITSYDLSYIRVYDVIKIFHTGVVHSIQISQKQPSIDLISIWLLKYAQEIMIDVRSNNLGVFTKYLI